MSLLKILTIFHDSNREVKFEMLASSLRAHVWDDKRESESRVCVGNRQLQKFSDFWRYNCTVSSKINVDLWKNLALWLSRGAVYECAIARAPV